MIVYHLPFEQACRKEGADFGGSEGAAGQRRCAALLPAPQILRLCDMPVEFPVQIPVELLLELEPNLLVQNVIELEFELPRM